MKPVLSCPRCGWTLRAIKIQDPILARYECTNSACRYGIFACDLAKPLTRGQRFWRLVKKGWNALKKMWVLLVLFVALPIGV